MATKKSTKPNYWLFKSEPDVYPIESLAQDRRTTWEGVRNYQARNLLRDEMKLGDGVLFYHSNAKPLAIVGVAKIVKEGYPDDTAWDPKAKYYDPKTDPENPAWFMVDVGIVKVFDQPVTREVMMADPKLDGFMLLARGSRLSVQPVSAAHWKHVLELAGESDLKL